MRVSNRGRQSWSSRLNPPVHLAYQVVDQQQTVLLRDGPRTPLPLPVYPGKKLSFVFFLRRPELPLPDGARLRLTLVQETVAWWETGPEWQPAVIANPWR